MAEPSSGAAASPRLFRKSTRVPSGDHSGPEAPDADHRKVVAKPGTKVRSPEPEASVITICDVTLLSPTNVRNWNARDRPSGDHVGAMYKSVSQFGGYATRV